MHGSLQSIREDRDFERTRLLAEELQQRYDVGLAELLELAGEGDILIPVTVFGPELSALETLSKYLHENIGLSFRKIAELMNRSEKTIWQAYNFSLGKFRKRLSPDDTAFRIPVSALSDRRYSNLESVVLFLKEHFMLRFAEIARLLHRDQRTVWTVYSRAKRK